MTPDSTPAPVAAAPPPVTRAQFLNLFAAVFLPMFMAAVDQTLLATATPAIAASLGGLRDTSWIMVAYLLAAAVIAPVYGRLGDRRGVERLAERTHGGLVVLRQHLVDFGCEEGVRHGPIPA